MITSSQFPALTGKDALPAMKMTKLSHPLQKATAPAKDMATQAAGKLGEATKLSLMAAKASRTDLRDPSKSK